MLVDAVKHVLAAGGREAASPQRQQWMDHQSVKRDRSPDKRLGNDIDEVKHHSPTAPPMSPDFLRLTFRITWANSSKAIESSMFPTGNLADRTDITKSKPVGKAGRFLRNTSRNRLRIRLRITPPPATRLETLSPIRLIPIVFGAACTAINWLDREQRNPKTDSNWAVDRSFIVGRRTNVFRLKCPFRSVSPVTIRSPKQVRPGVAADGFWPIPPAAPDPCHR